jgi:signal transduction histidine kinase
MKNTSPLSLELLVPKMGDYLVEKGLITQEQLTLALQEQERLRNRQEKSPLLGKILVQKGFITQENLDRAIAEQILQYQNALQEANQKLEQRVKERTAELEKALEQLHSLNELKSNLVANISHELRTPLTHLTGYLDLLLAGDLGPLNSQQRAALEVIQRSSERLAQLIEDLILFSVSEKNQIYLNIRPVNAFELLSSVYQRNSHKAIERQVQFHLDPPDNALMISADQEKVSWVLMQLVDNAIKFTPPLGTVSISTERDESFLKIQVSDTGIGIPANRIEHIFEPFVQLDGSSTRKAGGTGLGLALARRIIEAHGSVIHVHSEENKGSTFSFALRIVSV